MSRKLAAKLFFSCAAMAMFAGCADRQGWGVGAGQGTIDRQKSRAAAVDPFPLNDIGPEVVGGRPREYFNPQSEVVRSRAVPRYLPQSPGYPQ